MAKTLKKAYERKALKETQERARKAASQVLAEHVAATLLVERMNQDDLDKVSKIIDKLESIKSPQLPVLTKAIEQAQADVNKYAAGGPLSAAWNKIKGLAGVDNPVVKVTTFADALERGFSQIPTIIKNNLGSMQGIDTSKSLSDLMSQQTTQPKKQEQPQQPDNSKTTSSPPPSARGEDQTDQQKYRVSSQNEADATTQVTGKLKVAADQMMKALSPGGIFGAFKKVPYLDTKALVQELVTAPVSALAPVVKGLRTGVKASDVAPDMKDAITNTPGEGTTGNERAANSQPQSQSQQPQPSKGSTTSGTTTGTEQKPQRPVSTVSQRAFNDLKDAGIDKDHGINPAGLKAVIAALEDKGYLK